MVAASLRAHLVTSAGATARHPSCQWIRHLEVGLRRVGDESTLRLDEVHDCACISDNSVAAAATGSCV